jgi:hypothetical protein
MQPVLSCRERQIDYVRYNIYEDRSIDEQRFQEYKRLLQNLDLQGVSISVPRDGESVFMAYVDGFSPEGGVCKTYIYFRNGFPGELQSSLVECLDCDPEAYDPGISLYRRIDDSWCLWLLY